MSIIKNREQVVDELTDMLVKFSKEMNGYNTDVYAYFNEETKEVTLDTFVNVGGNSWLNDDHSTIYTDQQWHDDIFDSYDNEGDLLAAATNEDREKSEEIMNEIKKQIAEDEDIDIEDVSVSYFDIRDYIKGNDELMENLSNAHADLIDDMRADYAEQAENIVDKYEEKLKEEHQIDTADISSPDKRYVIIEETTEFKKGTKPEKMLETFIYESMQNGVFDVIETHNTFDEATKSLEKYNCTYNEVSGNIGKFIQATMVYAAEQIYDTDYDKWTVTDTFEFAEFPSPEKLCEIGFLNNGSAVMKLTYDDVEYVHNYDDMAQMARDYKDFMESPDTLSNWTEGNEPELWDDIYNDIAYLPYNSETDTISELNTDWGGNVSEFVSIINEANNDKSLSPDKEVENEPLFSKKKIMSDEFKPKSEKGKEDRSKSKNHNMEM